MDYLELYKKFTYSVQESYRLDHIANVETGFKKLDYEEYTNLHTLYKENYQKFIEYNIRDVELVDKIDEKMKFIDMILALAYSAKVNYNDVFSQVRMWDTMIYHHLRKKKIVLPPKDNKSKNAQYVGAYVKDPLVGMHKWIVSFDLNSLYPHLIMQFNISPETLIPLDRLPEDVKGLWQQKPKVDGLLEKEYSKESMAVLEENQLTLTPNNQYFRTDVRGFLPEMMDDLYEERKEFKWRMIQVQKKREKEGGHENEIAMYSNFQLARKVQLNSAYGALGNPYFRFYDVRLAEAVTQSGQLSIRWIENKMNKFLNGLLKTEDVDYVIASDTDSIYVTLEKLVDKVFEGKNSSTEKIVNFLDKVASEKLEPFIDKCYVELAEYVNAYDQKMQMTREIIANKRVWLSLIHI